MVKRINLNPDQASAMADLMAKLSAAAKAKNTPTAGVKDLGTAGDVTWTRPGGIVGGSLRDVDADLEDARGRLDDAEGTLTDAAERIEDAQETADETKARLDDPSAGLAEAIVQAMTTETKFLVVTDEAILNHATLLGETVVDQINVTGKLVGKDGVFTGTVDFANVNVTGEVLAESISGKTITGANIEGARIVAPKDPNLVGGIAINPQYGLRSWNTNGQLTMVMNGTDNFINGRFSTSRDGSPGIILTPLPQGGGGLYFSQSGSNNSSEAAIYSLLDGNVHIRPKASTPRGTVFIDGNLAITGGGALTADTTLNVEGIVIGSGEVATSRVTYWGSDGLTLRGQNATLLLTNTSDGKAQFASQAIYDRTASSSANVYVSSYGTLSRATSSRRYKKYISNWRPDPDTVLALQPRQWKPKVGNGEGFVDAEPSNDYYVGFIAEEVDELGLTELVTYSEDEDGKLRPEALNYDRFCAAQQVVIQRQEAQLQEQAAQIAAQDARMDALEARLAALEA